MPDLPLVDRILAPIFGGLLALAGGVAMWLHARAWRRQQDEDLEEPDRVHYRGRYRRRMQVSGLIALVGLMIGLGDALVPWQKVPTLFAIYWLAVILFATWILVLGLADMFATRAHTQAALARIRSQQRVLERQLAEARAQRDAEDGNERHRGNGHA